MELHTSQAHREAPSVSERIMADDRQPSADQPGRGVNVLQPWLMNLGLVVTQDHGEARKSTQKKLLETRCDIGLCSLLSHGNVAHTALIALAPPSNLVQLRQALLALCGRRHRGRSTNLSAEMANVGTPFPVFAGHILDRHSRP